jgi:phospholipid-binding lipoprotein MlaA
MKIVFLISFIWTLCLISFGPCLAEDLTPPLSEILIPQPNEAIQVKVAMAPPEFSLLGEPLDSVVSPLEPLVSLHPMEDSIAISQSDELLDLALANIPPAPLKGEEPEEVVVETIADPLEPINRAFFLFNDKFYFWLLKPVASGYKAVLPQVVRVSVRNFFSNVSTPIRLVNCLLQAKFECGGTETIRFLLNTTIGIAGLFDPAKTEFHIQKRETDFGATLGVWGIGPVIYFNWPILGPSSLRDTVGYVGDLFLDPTNYLITSTPINLAIKSYYQVNETSLTLGEYEDFKEAALDPYIALKDAYYQYRQNKIKGK